MTSFSILDLLIDLIKKAMTFGGAAMAVVLHFLDSHSSGLSILVSIVGLVLMRWHNRRMEQIAERKDAK